MRRSEIQSIIDKYNLKKIKTIRNPDKGLARSYIFKCSDEKGNLYCLKIFDSKDFYARERFKKEIIYTKKLRGRLSSRFKNYIPAMKGYSVSGDNPYYIYEFFEGDHLGKFVEDYGIRFGYFNLKNFDLFVSFIYEISKIDTSDMDISSWKKRVATKEINYYLDQLKNDTVVNNLYDQILEKIESLQKNAFKYTSSSHRDLYPENILIKDRFSKEISFIDWEYFSEVPIGFNAAFIYLLFWREEFWKAKVFSYFYNKYEEEGPEMASAFLDSFSYCILVLSLRFLYQISTFGVKKDKSFGHAYRSFLFDLQNCITTDLISPKNIKFHLNINDVKKIGARYGIKGIKKYVVFYASKGNTVARVDTESKSYIFRIYSQSRDEELIYRELRIFNKLRESGLNTYAVYKTKQGRMLLKQNLYGRERRIVVLSFVKGKKISRQWADEVSAVKLGETLRDIHDANVTHGDYSKENVLFYKNRVSGIIDFEWGHITRSRRAKDHDLAKSIALWLVDVRSKKLEDIIFCEKFLKGYFGSDKVSESRMFNLLDLVINKIENERAIFLTTIDLGTTEVKATRFQESIDTINQLKLYYKEGRISLHFHSS